MPHFNFLQSINQERNLVHTYYIVLGLVAIWEVNKAITSSVSGEIGAHAIH